IAIVLVSIPLNQSYRQLRSEISDKQQENRLRSAATEIWQKNFASFVDGRTRSYISQLSLQEQERQLVAQLQVVTSKIYTEAEREQYRQRLAVKLVRPSDSIALNLIQIPTASSDLLQRIPEEIKPTPPPTLSELQASFLKNMGSMLDSLSLPSPAQLVSYKAGASPEKPFKMQIVYLSQRDIDRDGQALLVQDIRRQLNDPTAQVNFKRIAPLTVTVTFELNQSEIPPTQIQELDQMGQLVQNYPRLRIEMTSGQTASEIGTPAQARSQALQTYLKTKWQILPERFILKTGTELKPTVKLQMKIGL
ncbi:MAG: hypothetical protein WCA35_06990, partial [Kovacikia sp.]